MLSTPPPPLKVSAPAEPVMVSAEAPPVTFTEPSVSALALKVSLPVKLALLVVTVRLLPEAIVASRSVMDALSFAFSSLTTSTSDTLSRMLVESDL